MAFPTRIRAWSVALFVVASAPCFALAEGPAEQAPVYEQEVAPLLSRYCGDCHNETARKGDLDLLSLQGILRGGESGQPAVAAGDLDQSPLWRMIEAGEMPPSDAPRPQQHERETIRRWIEQGAASQASEGNAADQAWRQSAWRVMDMLEWNCSVCHGARVQQGGLDVRSVASLLKGGKSGSAIVAGDAEASLLVKKLAAGEMPPFKERYPFAVRAASDEELAALREWIDAGAVDPGPRPQIGDEQAVATAQDRSWWAFQPLSHPATPAVQDDWPRTMVDAFLAARQREQGVSASQEADRRLFARRAFVDLIGLPPSPEELETFLADESPNAHEKLLDRLLTSPRYGQRQAQHWLDAAGFAESEGLESADPIFEEAWRFRDYVIRSLNAGKPFDQFLVEQIAGDELLESEGADSLSPADADRLIATGFLRTAMDSTREPAVNFPVNRLQVIDDTVDMVSTNLLGLTLRCARCHSHKYDPLSQRDYYRLGAVFASAYAPSLWLKPAERLVPLATAAEQQAIAAHNGPLEQQLAMAKTRQEELTAEFTPQLQEKKLAAVPEPTRTALKTALATAAECRTAEQETLLKQHADRVAVSSEELSKEFPHFAEKSRQITSEVESLTSQLRTAPLAHSLRDVAAEPPPFHLLTRGEWRLRAAVVAPGVPAVLRPPADMAPEQAPLPSYDWTAPEPSAKTSGRRLSLARWLVDARHPLTWRVLVNRLFRDLFGTGIVSTVGDFGRTGQPPSHPQLLDRLAGWWIDSGHDLKRLHRLLATSAAYRQQSRHRPEAAAIDPENRLLWRMPLRRLDAESLRDAVLAASGELNLRMGGPSARHETQADGQVITPDQADSRRRSIYMIRRRLTPETLLETFDAPRLNAACVERRASTVVNQSLLLLHSPFLETQSLRMAEKIRLLRSDPAGQIEQLYAEILGRPPTDEERRQAEAFLALPSSDSPSSESSAASTDMLAELALVLFNAAEFLYVD